MSAFCVFGMTEVIARQSASKKSPPPEWDASTEAFYNDYEERIYKTGTPRQVSLTFDAPQFCQDWIDLARKQMRTRSLKIMYRGKMTDKHGVPRINKKTNEPVMGWVPYEQA